MQLKPLSIWDLIGFIGLAAANIFAQEKPIPEPVNIPLDTTAAPCRMTVKDAPTINGIKLGLTPDELSTVLKIKIAPSAPNDVEVSTFQVGERNKSVLPHGIKTINLNFFNNRLYYAQIYFDNALPKKTAGTFAMALSEKKNFSKAWVRTTEEQSAHIDRVYLVCAREVRFIVHTDSVFDLLQLDMIDLRSFEHVIQKRKQINNAKTSIN